MMAVKGQRWLVIFHLLRVMFSKSWLDSRVWNGLVVNEAPAVAAEVL